MPRQTCVGGITPAALPEVGGHAIELPPTDYHLVSVSRINRNRTLVRGVADYVVAISIDVHLVADEGPVRHNHPRPSFQPVNISRWIIVRFQLLFQNCVTPFLTSKGHELWKRKQTNGHEIKCVVDFHKEFPFRARLGMVDFRAERLATSISQSFSNCRAISCAFLTLGSAGVAVGIKKTPNA